MKTTGTAPSASWYLKIAPIIMPILITCIVPILLLDHLSIKQLVGSGVILIVCLLSIVAGETDRIPEKDVAIIWVATVLYNLYLLTYIL